MTLKLALTVTLNGLTLAALYFIVASGFSLIFGLMRIVNMAHGSLYLIGAYFGGAVFYPLYDRDNAAAWYAALAAAVAAASLSGALIHVAFLRWMQGQELRQALVTVGLSVIISDQILARFGGQPFQLFAPDSFFGSVDLALIGSYPAFRLVQIGLATAIGLGLWLLLNGTRLGIYIRAGVDDRAMLRACGVDVNRLATVVFALGAALTGIAGVIGATAQPVALGVDAKVLLNALVVVIVGGMGSLVGTAVGSVLVGVAEQWGQALAPTYSLIFIFLGLVGILAVRPHGLFGRPSA